jgi:hypothetical protein
LAQGDVEKSLAEWFYGKMSATIPYERELFRGGPPFWLQKWLHLITPGDPKIARRAIVVVLFGWVPLLVLAVAQGLAWHGGTEGSFLLDFAVHARSLVVAPLLIMAESLCIPRLGTIARHFLQAGLVAEGDQDRFDKAVTSTRRLLHSPSAELMSVTVAFGLVAILNLQFPHEEFLVWQRPGNGQALSLAGWWHLAVSVPWLLVLFMGWLWRIVLWGRFMWLMSRLDLQLIASHPDRAGGLKFVGTSIPVYAPLGLALGTLVAGGVANRVVHEGASLRDFGFLVAGLVVFVLFLFVGPLLVFFRNLRQLKVRGTFEYGALAEEVGSEFERKWLNRADGINESALEVPDFSATTDLYQIVSNVHELSEVPFDLKHLRSLIIAVLLPFVPVAMAAVPLKTILETVAKLLL